MNKLNILFCHECCNRGLRALGLWLDEENKSERFYHVELVGIFNVKDRELHTKFNFELSDLKKYSFIIRNDECIKILNEVIEE